MATPRNNTYPVGSGGGVFAGRPGLPEWLAGAVPYEVVEIADTEGAGGSQIDAFSGFAVTTDGDIVIPAAGGHFDSDDNRVVKLSLAADAPSWTTLLASSASTQENVTHYSPDGRPTSRHTYTTPVYVPSLGRVFLTGCTFAYGDGNSYAAVDAFHVASSTWDVAGTYEDLPEGDDSNKAGVVFDGTHIWTNTLGRFNPAANSWSAPITSRISPYPESPWAFDSSRSQLFGLQYSGGAARASKVPIGGSTETAITFNSGAAYTQWLADGPVDAGMAYIPTEDVFWFYDGRGSAAGRIYVITPNSGTTWDMSILSTTGATLPATNANGLNGRIRWVEALGGAVILPSESAALHFIKAEA